MAAVAASQGVTKIIATPHHGTKLYSNTAEQIRSKVIELNNELKRRGIPLQVWSGQEYSLSEFYQVEHQGGRLQPLADSSYLLVELPGSNIPAYFNEFMAYMKRERIQIVIAHPERYAGIIRKPNLLMEWLNEGVHLQLTTQSLMGLFGKKVQKTAMLIAQKKWAYFLASDAHNTFQRSFYLQEGYQMVERLAGSDYAKHLLRNAEELLYGYSNVRQ